MSGRVFSLSNTKACQSLNVTESLSLSKGEHVLTKSLAARNHMVDTGYISSLKRIYQTKVFSLFVDPLRVKEEIDQEFKAIIVCTVYLELRWDLL